MKIKDESVLYKSLSNQKHIPFTAHWELTYECDNKCMHCVLMNVKHKFKNTELPLERVKEVLVQLVELGCKKITFSGGDALLYNGLDELIKDAYEYGLVVTVYTAGQRITEEWADLFQKYKVAAVEVTILGYEELHDYITRKKGAYQNFINGIQMLLNRNISVIVKSTLNKLSYRFLNEMRDFFEDMGCSFQYDAYIWSPWEGSEKQISAIDPNEFQMEDFYKNYFRAPRLTQFNMCTAGTRIISINPRGDVLPCSVYYGVSFGNLRETDLIDIWYGNEADQFRKSTNPYPFTECLECDIKEHCDWCPGMHFWGTGKKELYRKVCRNTMIKSRNRVFTNE